MSLDRTLTALSSSYLTIMWTYWACTLTSASLSQYYTTFQTHHPTSPQPRSLGFPTLSIFCQSSTIFNNLSFSHPSSNPLLYAAQAPMYWLSPSIFNNSLDAVRLIEGFSSYLLAAIGVAMAAAMFSLMVFERPMLASVGTLAEMSSPSSLFVRLRSGLARLGFCSVCCY
jgi:hypothetical protein